MKLSDFNADTGITALAGYGYNASIIVACDKELFLLYGINLVSGSVQFTKKVKLAIGLSILSTITTIVPDPRGPGIAVVGSNFIAVLSIPIELWSDCGVPELLQGTYFCDSSFVQENVFLGDAHPIEVIWSREEDTDDDTTLLIVLSSDCAIRFYELSSPSSLDYRSVKVDLVEHIPNLSSASSNTYGLYKNIESMAILFRHSRQCHLLLIDSEGESHLASVHTSSALLPPSVSCLDLPVELSSAFLFPKKTNAAFNSVIGLAPKGVVHHLIAVIGEDGVEGVRVVDSMAFPSAVLSISPFHSGALVRTTESIYAVDVSPTTSYLNQLVLGEDEAAWLGMHIVECAHMPPKSFSPSIPVVSVPRDNDTHIIVHLTLGALRATVLSYQWETKGDERNTSIAGGCTVHKEEAINDKIKAMIKEKEVIAKNVCTRNSDESELLTSFLATLTTTRKNLQVLRNTVHLASSWVCGSGLARVEAVEGARSTHDAAILALYQSLNQSDERLYNNQMRTQALIKKSNMLWNSLASRSIDVEKDAEMARILRELSKRLDALTRAIPKVTLDMEMARKDVSRAAESTAPLKRRAKVIAVAEEINALEKRCERIDKMIEMSGN